MSYPPAKSSRNTLMTVFLRFNWMLVTLTVDIPVHGNVSCDVGGLYRSPSPGTAPRRIDTASHCPRAPTAAGVGQRREGTSVVARRRSHRTLYRASCVEKEGRGSVLVAVRRYGNAGGPARSIQPCMPKISVHVGRSVSVCLYTDLRY